MPITKTAQLYIDELEKEAAIANIVRGLASGIAGGARGVASGIAGGARSAYSGASTGYTYGGVRGAVQGGAQGMYTGFGHGFRSRVPKQSMHAGNATTTGTTSGPTTGTTSGPTTDVMPKPGMSFGAKAMIGASVLGTGAAGYSAIKQNIAAAQPEHPQPGYIPKVAGLQNAGSTLAAAPNWRYAAIRLADEVADEGALQYIRYKQREQRKQDLRDQLTKNKPTA